MTIEELEQQKQKLLVNLNNVFDNPEKEKELRILLEAVELSIDVLKNNGGVKKSFLSEEVPAKNSEDVVNLNSIKLEHNNPLNSASHTSTISSTSTISNRYFDFNIIKMKQTSLETSKLYYRVNNKTNEILYICDFKITIGDMSFNYSNYKELDKNESLVENSYIFNLEDLELCGMSNYSELKECVFQLRFQPDGVADEMITDPILLPIKMELYER